MSHTCSENPAVQRTLPPRSLLGKRRKPRKSQPSAKVLIQDGWSVPVVQTFEDFRMADTGVFPATRSEVEEAIRELPSR